MKNKTFLATVLLMFALWPNKGADASQRYKLHLQWIAGRGETKVWMFDRVKKRILWKRQFGNVDPENIHWAKNRRAIAIGADAYPTARVLVWREGEPLRDFGLPHKNEYTMGCIWSPDNQRLLVRVGGSGANYADVGVLFCYELENWPHYKIFELGGARKMAWRGRSTVVFQDVEVINPQENPRYGNKLMKPRFWNAP